MNLLRHFLSHFFLFTLWLCLSQILISCSPPATDSQPELTRPVYKGDLVKKTESVYNSENEANFYHCDSLQKNKVLEISAAVENQREEIAEMVKKNYSAPQKYINQLIGKMTFSEPINRVTGKNEWTEFTESWTEAAVLFESIKNDPKNSNWIQLNSMTRSLILEDEDRILYSIHPWRRKESETLIRSTLQATATCFEDPKCLNPNYSDAQMKWINLGLRSRKLVRWIQNPALTPNERRTALEKAVRYFKNTIRRYDLKKYDLATVENNTLIVPMDLSVFGDDAGKFSELIEKKWTFENFHVQIKNTQNTPNVFKVLLSDLTGERAFVSRSDRIMQLYNPGKVWTVIHEFGHVLGLRDEYFTSFDISKCEYIYQDNDGDLMSASNSGIVLPENIEKLRKIYEMPDSN